MQPLEGPRIILRLGAQQEGIVRHERIMPDGRKRNAVRQRLLQRLDQAELN